MPDIYDESETSIDDESRVVSHSTCTSRGGRRDLHIYMSEWMGRAWEEHLIAI